MAAKESGLIGQAIKTQYGAIGIALDIIGEIKPQILILRLEENTLCLKPYDEITVLPTFRYKDNTYKFLADSIWHYVSEGFLHRDDGPAIEWVDKHGKVSYKRFFLHGQEFETAEEYFDALSPEAKEDAIFNLDTITLNE